MSLFHKKPTANEILRESKRGTNAALRDIDKEVLRLQAEEKKLVKEIKQAAASGQQSAAKLFAKDLIRLRNQITKMQSSKTHLKSVNYQAQTMNANLKISQAMHQSGQVMASMNKQMNPMEQAKMLQQFQKESAQMDMTEEFMSESLDETLNDEDTELESEDLTNQILDEIGIQTSAQLVSAPKSKVNVPTQHAESSSSSLENRFSALKGGN